MEKCHATSVLYVVLRKQYIYSKELFVPSKKASCVYCIHFLAVSLAGTCSEPSIHQPEERGPRIEF